MKSPKTMQSLLRECGCTVTHHNFPPVPEVVNKSLDFYEALAQTGGPEMVLAQGMTVGAMALILDITLPTARLLMEHSMTIRNLQCVSKDMYG